MNDIFSAANMDISLQEVYTHAATLAVSPLRPNGLNDFDNSLSTIEYVLAHPHRPGGFHVDAIAPLPADASYEVIICFHLLLQL